MIGSIPLKRNYTPYTDVSYKNGLTVRVLPMMSILSTLAIFSISLVVSIEIISSVLLICIH